MLGRKTVEKLHVTTADYFEFETRLRQIVTDILHPISMRLKEYEFIQRNQKNDHDKHRKTVTE